jgi:hypothetical protein
MRYNIADDDWNDDVEFAEDFDDIILPDNERYIRAWLAARRDPDMY